MIAGILSIDAVNQKQLGTPGACLIQSHYVYPRLSRPRLNSGRRQARAAACDGCVLSALQTQLAMPLASKDDIATVLSSLTASCGSTIGFAPNKPPTATTFTISATNGPVDPPSCVGTTYTVSNTDKCQDVSTLEGISTYDLLWSNNLTAWCEDFPKSGSLCIPRSAICKPYTVKTEDTCGSIQQAFGISYAQIVAWNPPLGLGCQGLDKSVGYVICVSPPGGAWVDPRPTTTTPKTRSALGRP